MLVEIWQPNAKWHALTEAEKREFLDGIGDAANAARAGGMEIVGWGALDGAVSNPVPQGFCGVFFVDTREEVHAVDAAIREAGWYEYFDHANVAAELHGRDGVAASEALCDLLGVRRG
jgi:hypothetical protein